MGYVYRQMNLQTSHDVYFHIKPKAQKYLKFLPFKVLQSELSVKPSLPKISEVYLDQLSSAASALDDVDSLKFSLAPSLSS